MPLSLYGISSILKSSGVDNNYVRTYTDSEAKHDIISHLKTGNSIIFEVRQKTAALVKEQSAGQTPTILWCYSVY